ncbi:MAG: IS3 family transposase [Nitrospirota bacterium]
MTQVVQNLGSNAAMLGRWCREATQRRPEPLPESGRLTIKELARLKRGFVLVTRERVHRRQYRTRAEIQADIFDDIKWFYNHQRRPSFPQGLAP